MDKSIVKIALLVLNIQLIRPSLYANFPVKRSAVYNYNT